MMVAGTSYVKADVGDTFTTKTKEGVKMIFEVTNEEKKYCKVGESGYASNSDACIDHSVTGTVTIPETAMGYTVTSVAPYAFQFCSIEEVIVPSSVSVNYAGIFYQCKNLKKFWFNRGIDRVPHWFFYGCEALEDVYLPITVRYIMERAFKDCKSLHELQLPEYVEEIGTQAFSGMTYCDFLCLRSTPPTFASDCFNGMGVDDYGEYGKAFGSTFWCRNKDVADAYYEALKKVPYLSADDMFISVYDYVYSLRDREATGYMIEGSPDYENGVIQIYRYAEIPPADVTELKIPERIKALSVDRIGNIYRYEGSTTIKKVVLPSTVKIIDLAAFRDFSAMESINFPEGLETIYTEAFHGCSSLKMIEFPSSFKSLERGAFSGCPNLSKVTMNAREVSLFSGEYAHNSNCNATMYVPFGTLKNFDSEAWRNEFAWRMVMDAKDGDIFPSEFKSGKDMWFQVISAKDKTCRVYGDENSSDVRAIDKAYEGAANIPQKPEGFTVVEIGNYAFNYCTKLTVVNIPNTVKRIGEAAFSVCNNLVSVNIPASVEVIDDVAFSWDSKLASVTLNEGLKEIASGAFAICTELYSVTLPSTLKKLGDTAFFLCSNLSSINIPDGITSIGKLTFQSCSSLTEIDLPASVASLGSNCFQNCKSLSDVTIRNSHVLLLDSDGNVCDDNAAFYYDGSRYSELHAPEGTMDYYGVSPWTTWFNYIGTTLPYIATDVNAVETEVATQSPWYTIDGRRLDSKPANGLYIHNGKKVMVK